MKTVHYVTGSRADFGLMRACLAALDGAAGIDLGLVITGQHTVMAYGGTGAELRASGLPVAGEIPVRLSGSDGAEMGLALAQELTGFLELWQADRPDLVLVLGDRGEMLAAALAAVHLGIHVAHLHGGERSGTLDESFRHAISKLAHIHLPATRAAADRLIAMGERADTCHVIGAPGLCDLATPPGRDADALRARFGLAPDAPLALVLFHPVVQEADQALAQVRAVITAVAQAGYAMVLLRPNSDAGGRAIDVYIDGLDQGPMCRVETHLARSDYLAAVASVDLIVGNSSSGIIESASLGVPCLNIGSRQDGRERNPNTVDVAGFDAAALTAGIAQTRALRGPFDNIYGDGRSDARLADVLQALVLTPEDLKKLNTF